MTFIVTLSIVPDIHCRLHLKFSFSFSNDQEQLFCHVIFQLCLICDIDINEDSFFNPQGK